MTGGVPPDPKAPVQEGDVVAGKYRIEGHLGSGGMGVVMAARHLTLGEPVALKFVTEGRGSDPEAAGRMMREARATFRLRSEHTVRVLDVGELPSGPLYIVMELLEGRDLRAELKTRGTLPEAEVVRYALQACEALEEAHALGIVHRDLKPHNMFLAKSARGGTVLKILDFGMSKLDPEQFDAEAGPLTRPETALGTPRYMAPEQWKSATAVDARADIWALGVVMYELLTGEAPVSKLRGADRLARLLAGAIEDPRELHADVSEPVARVIMRCLRADPKGRWPSIAHLRTALRDAAPGLAGAIPRAEVTRTDVTRPVPSDVMKERAARAFARARDDADEPDVADLVSAGGPPTRRATPAALQQSPAPADAEPPTEIQPPQFPPPSQVVESVAAPAHSTAAPTQPLPRVVASKPNVSTLRSAAGIAGAAAAIHALAHADPRAKTQPMADAPRRAVLPTTPDSPPAPSQSPAASTPQAVPAPPSPARFPPHTKVLLAAGGIVSLAALVLVGWWVSNLLAR
jgi:eukaryotic-like serine/threonine-protein kinase